ncbi:MAG: hypothetical protein ACJ789_03255 [Thermomicrobiales bacterium]
MTTCAIAWAVVAAATIVLVVTQTSIASPPAASPPPDAPTPELCVVGPRSFAEISSLSSRPINARPPEPTPTPGPIPQGTPADPATTDGVTATVRELVACFNAGELLRAYGLYSDRYLGRLLSRQNPTTRAAYDALATPLPSRPEDRAKVLDVHGVRELPDGRVGALVTIKYAVVPVAKTFLFTFVENDGHWMIDDIRGEISFALP